MIELRYELSTIIYNVLNLNASMNDLIWLWNRYADRKNRIENERTPRVYDISEMDSDWQDLTLYNFAEAILDGDFSLTDNYYYSDDNGCFYSFTQLTDKNCIIKPKLIAWYMRQYIIKKEMDVDKLEKYRNITLHDILTIVQEW